MYLNKYNNLLASGGLSTKEPKDEKILYLVEVNQKLVEDFKKKLENSKMNSTKV